MALARTLVKVSGTGGLMAMNGLSLPLNNLMHQLGVHPDQSKDVMSRGVIPVMLDHTAELETIQAESYAAFLSPDTMKAAIAFYSSPAGREFLKARTPMLQMNAQAVRKLFDKLMPEFRAAADEVLKAKAKSKG